MVPSRLGQSRQVLDALMDGLDTDQIAARVHLSTGGVKYHLTNLMRRYGVTHRSALALARARELHQFGRWPPPPPTMEGPTAMLSTYNATLIVEHDPGATDEQIETGLQELAGTTVLYPSRVNGRVTAVLDDLADLELVGRRPSDEGATDAA